jgi:TrkA domain protein
MGRRDVEVRAQDLPGIGRRFEIGCSDGGRISVVIQNNGLRDIYSFEPGRDQPDSALQVSDEQARALGAILTGVYFQPTIVEDVEAAVGDLSIDWVALARSAPAVGRSVGELGLRGRSDVVLVAIVRDGKARLTPGDAEVLRAGDRVVLAGRREDLAPVRNAMAG